MLDLARVNSVSTTETQDFGSLWLLHGLVPKAVIGGGIPVVYRWTSRSRCRYRCRR